MGKKGELWDDSALIKAFDNAVNTYKIMHAMVAATEEEKETTDGELNLQVTEDRNGTGEARSKTGRVENNNTNDLSREATAKIEEVASLLQIKDNPSSNLSPAKNEVPFVIQNSEVPVTNGNHSATSVSCDAHTVSSDGATIQAEGACHSDGQDQYNQLLNKYYILENQRQKIIQQLNQQKNWNYHNQYNDWNYHNQYNNWDYHFPVPSTFTSEEYNAPDLRRYECGTCYCPYGCQNWVVPGSSFPACCQSGNCVDKSCNSASKATEHRNTMVQQDADIVKMAMVAAERALSSLTNEASDDMNASANIGKQKEIGVETGCLTESTQQSTDLELVLKAWYSAGFYTGKYLSEQSSVKGKHGQGR